MPYGDAYIRQVSHPARGLLDRLADGQGVLVRQWGMWRLAESFELRKVASRGMHVDAIIADELVRHELVQLASCDMMVDTYAITDKGKYVTRI